MKVNAVLRASLGILLFCVAGPGSAQIATTKHNLSSSGPGQIKSSTEEEICVFCHVPHDARPSAPFLWNREDSTANYTTYESSTLYGTVGQPTGSSKLCLSCHDGTIALGAVVSRPAEIPFAGGIRFLPDTETKLGTDLSDDHPVSFTYDETLATDNGELVSPSSLPSQVTLDNDKVQCTSCHDPHDDSFGKFLVMPNQYSALCVVCHSPTGWLLGSHGNSSQTWPGAGPDPWPDSAYGTVAENGCANCHQTHTAGGHERLMNYAVDETNCLVCHNGNVADTDIESELIKTYGHFVQNYNSEHDPAEDFTGPVNSHVECADCHNPHQTNATTGTAPNLTGALAGVTGISSSGGFLEKADFAYEICFKCHADNNVVTFAEISRDISQINTRFEFDITNPSYHPVTATGKNPNVPSLLPDYTVNSRIYCTDCHNSDDNPATGGIGPQGPHGSVNKYLLELNYTTDDFTAESSYEYALCYKCHDKISILDDESFSAHKKHIEDKNTPCSACHDPHGISSSQGNATNNSFLINFDTNIVFTNGSGLRKFENLPGTFQGQCFLLCHEIDHDPKTYP